MARCRGCGQAECNCLVVGGTNVAVSGDGSLDEPYVIDVSIGTTGLPPCPGDPGIEYFLTCTDGILAWVVSPDRCVVI